MSFSMKNLQKVTATKPPRMLIYGPPGIGKTTLSTEFPNPVFIQVEDGTPAGVELNSFGILSSYGEVMDALRCVYEDDHDCATLVIDSVTELQRLIFAETCARGDEKGNAKANIEDFGYGKGYVYATRVAGEFIEAINAIRNERNMAIVLLAHSTVSRFDDPETVSYDRYEIALRSSDKPNADIRGMFERDMDAIILMKQPVSIKTEDAGMNKERAIAGGGSSVVMHTVGKPSFTAKNRYNMPPTIRYDLGKGFTAMEDYLPPIGTPKISTNQEAA